ncbi:MAG: hypothetical protein KDN05_13765, partial [Verrucomicrobiae bacterium]|nr:hypothetical protein [Verrucomicrobiae bacterium]
MNEIESGSFIRSRSHRDRATFFRPKHRAAQPQPTPRLLRRLDPGTFQEVDRAVEILHELKPLA